MKKIIIVLMVMCSLFLIGCKNTNSPTDSLILDESKDFKRLNNVKSLSNERKDENIDEEFIKSLYSFSNLTVKELYEESNMIYSPTSLYFALAMLYEGTEGKAREELTSLMKVNNLRSNLQSIYKNNYYSNNNGTNKIANSFWLNNNYEIEEEYGKILEEYYFAESYSTNFNTESVEKICKWINHQTGNLLEMKPSDLKLDKGTVLALINTVYFNNKWKYEFKKENIKEGLFNNIDNVTYLNHVISSKYYRNEICEVTYDYYHNDNKIMYILPRNSIKEVLDSNIFELINKGNMMEVNLTVPKFDVKSSFDLIEALKNLGVNEIFNQNTKDIKSIKGTDVFVSTIKQDARIVLDEEGTKAAAVTIIGAKNESVEPDITINFKLDRPFIYVILDSKDVPLFIGTINKF